MNTLHLFEQPSSSRLRHGGITEEVRQFVLLINGTEIEQIRDDSPATGYAKGKDLDRHIRERIKLFETALDCKATRGRTRNPVSTALGPFARYVELMTAASVRTLTDAESSELAEIGATLEANDRRSFGAARRGARVSA